MKPAEEIRSELYKEKAARKQLQEKRNQDGLRPSRKQFKQNL